MRRVPGFTAQQEGGEDAPRGLDTLARCLQRYVEAKPQLFRIQAAAEGGSAIQTIVLAVEVTEP